MKKVLFLIILFLSVAQAWAVDTYNPANGQLTIPLVTVGTIDYSNVVTSVPTFGTSLVEQESHLIVTHSEFDPKGQQLGRFQTC